METKIFDKKFENFRKDAAITNKQICWTCVVRFVEKNWHCKNLFSSNSGDKVITFCLDILMTHDCIDKTYLYRLLKFYFRWHYHICSCEDRGPEKEYARIIMKPLKIFVSSPLNLPLSEVDIETLPVCVTDVRIMLILSKYGIYTGRSIFNIGHAEKSFVKFMLSIREGEPRNVETAIFMHVATHILASFRKNNGKMPVSENQRGMRYFYMIIKILHALSLDLEGSPFIAGFIKCLRVFYRTVPDPFVSQIDLKEFLHFVWLLFPIPLISLESVTDIYLRLFKNECPELYGPRSLKHLCRVSVRRTLKSKLKMLPHSVKRLDIPRALHDYLLCMEPLHM